MFDILQREDRASSEDNDTRLIDTVLYSPSRMAARDFTLKARLASRALVGQQERVRLVIVGDGNVADDIMLDAIRHSHAIGLAGPLIQRVVTDVTIANNRLFRRCDAFRNSSKIASKSAPLSWAAEWEFIEWDLANSPVSTMIEQLQEIDASPITAIAVAHSDLVLNLSISISIREKLRKGELKCCTLMVYLPYQTSLDSIFFAAPGGLGLKEKHTELENTQETFSFGYFGRIESICDLDVFWGKPEALARLLHDAYRTQFFAEQPEAKLLKIEDLPENLHPWSALRDTYKRANRRAVEHLDSKLASLGLHKIDSPSLVERLSHSLRNDIEMEQLATLEHNSWRIERELDGWQYAQERDNVKKLHPDLKPYQELEDATKEFDREQIRFLFEFLLSRRKQLRNL